MTQIMQNVCTWIGRRVYCSNRKRLQGGGMWAEKKQDWGKRKINQNLPDTKDPLLQLRPFLTQSDSIVGPG